MRPAARRSLLAEIQMLLERTYASTGLNIEEFLIGRERCRQLSIESGRATAELAGAGCVFLRVTEGNLMMAIYYEPSLIETLERFDPRRGLSELNIRPFAVFVEEITHAMHAALRFLEGERAVNSESSVRNLELQARVDCYLVLQLYCARFRRRRRLEDTERRWLRHHLFARETFDYDDPALRDRYAEVNYLGKRYAGRLDTLAPARRVEEIRRFRRLSYPEKRARVLNLN